MIHNSLGHIGYLYISLAIKKCIEVKAFIFSSQVKAINIAGYTIANKGFVISVYLTIRLPVRFPLSSRPLMSLNLLITNFRTEAFHSTGFKFSLVLNDAIKNITPEITYLFANISPGFRTILISYHRNTLRKKPLVFPGIRPVTLFLMVVKLALAFNRTWPTCLLNPNKSSMPLFSIEKALARKEPLKGVE
jgi:hypothetical protein